MRYFFIFLSFVFVFSLSAQNIEYKFRVYLKDKGTTNYSVSEPEKFLSQVAIERRQRQNVAIDESDLPISRDYFTLVERAGGRVVSYSKWFQTFVVQVPDSARITAIEQLPFVESVRYVWRGNPNSQQNEMRPRLQKTIDCDQYISANNYFGRTANQFTLHNAETMSMAGFRGKGIKIGVIDAGFANVDVIPYFDNLRLGGFQNFVPQGEVFSGNDHGTSVLSTMLVQQPGLMIGSAPDATYWLLRSEDVATEFPVEEDYWVRAIEFADSVGIDIANTSLGYSTFDDPSLNYTHADLTGRVSIMSRAADKAFSKGMLLVVSAGNEGNKPWQKTTAPGDAHNVITVGAVGTDGEIANFSSHGLTADGRIKPDIVSVGRETIVIGRYGVVRTANGTSFSSPFVTGLIASLWSINPDLHRSEVIDIVKQSSDRFHSPDTVFGKGIPDFQKATAKMLQTLNVHIGDISENGWNIARTEVGYTIGFNNAFKSSDPPSFVLLDEEGRILSSYVIDSNTSSISVSVSSEVRSKNEYLYFVVNEGDWQRVFRVKS
ncbi:MAG: S8 family serine peptidase [Dysgonamonadaceae bacterium]|nr:S8 family serine peptidase [Dysgonamonadaceae bacterium]